MRWLAVGVVGAALALAGCAQVDVREKAYRLETTIQAYRKALRWGEYQAAHGFVRRRDGAEPALDAELLESIRVTDYEVVRREVIDEASEAVVVTHINFYHADSGRVRNLADQQLWYYDEKDDRWFLDGGLPDFAGALR